MRTGGYGGPVGFLVKKYTCPVIFLGCPGRPGLVFVGPCKSFDGFIFGDNLRLCSHLVPEH